MPISVPNPVRIFHITAIPNLASIVASGAIQAKTLLAERRAAYSNIAYQGAQGRRAVKTVTKGPRGVIHDYVPFYFAPRSPMLFTINSGNVDGCLHRQQDIAHLATTVDAVCARRLEFVFYNFNATLSYAECLDELAELEKIDWPLFFEEPRIDGYCKYWNSRLDSSKYAQRMETRQAEFLVYREVPLEIFEIIGVCNESKANEVRAILKSAGMDLPVKVKPGWYY
jgi:ssDNA thymidine ADP-ribosyltransferase, DarT